MVELRTVYSHDQLYSIPCDDEIVDCRFSLFYAWKGFSEPVHTWAKGYPVLVLVLLNIHPSIEEVLGFSIEHIIMGHLKGIFRDDANLFAGMGRSEILLIFRGNSFEKILPSISEIRKELTISSLGKVQELKVYAPNAPVLMRTTSFLTIAHPALLGTGDYKNLAGRVLPQIRVSCQPGHEYLAAAKAPISCKKISNLYGRYDVTLTWNETVELKEFALELTTFRQQLSQAQGVRGTMTSFLGGDIIPDKKATQPPPPPTAFLAKPIPFIEELKSLSKKLEPTVRAQLEEFLNRLNSYHSRIESRSSFADMIGICHSLSWVFDELEQAQEQTRHSLHNYLSQVIDLANNALYQRYAGLESHFTYFKHTPFPFLWGINGYIASASCLPCFIFRRVFYTRSLGDSWAGFVLFGQSYSYQWLNQAILSYQSTALNKPIEEWWGITHEVAHAIYWISQFFEKRLPEDLREYAKGLAEITEGRFLIDIEEIYANWFDFRYIFAGDETLYFPTIWKSWLRWDRVWQFKEQYLFRSFSIFLCSELDSFFKARTTKSHQSLMEYCHSIANRMNLLIASTLPVFSELAQTVDSQSWEEIFEGILRVHGYLSFLENQYFDEKVLERLNPAYPQELLDEHIISLEKGTVVIDDIPNPVRLLLQLHTRYTVQKKQVPFQLTASTLLTLWYQYLKNYKGDYS